MKHPTVIACQKDFDRVKKLYGKDKFITKITDRLYDKANKLLNGPVKSYLNNDTREIRLNEWHEDVDILSCAYKLSGDDAYAMCAIAIMDIACKFPDWQSKIFLITSTMAAGMAIGYDWLYDILTEKQRSRYQNAIIELALTPAIEAYNGIATYTGGFEEWFGRLGWVKSRTNWNGVCNSGLIMGAVAVYNEHPQIAEEVLKYALQSLSLLKPAFEPDGGFEEGISYWFYLNLYLARMMSTLNCAYGTDYDVFSTDAFRRSIYYAVFMNHGEYNFNFHDVGVERNIDTSPLMYYAKRFNMPGIGRIRIDDFEAGIIPVNDNIFTTDLLWYDPLFAENEPENLPEDIYFRKIETAVLKEDDIAVALHGGDNMAIHGHCDNGSVIIDALGKRWVCDLGKELLTYASNGEKYCKWDLYRIRAEGHNTLIINPSDAPDQITDSVCKIIEFKQTKEKSKAVLNLTPAYKDAKNITRTVELDKVNKVISIIDQITLNNPGKIYSFLHTRASVRLTNEGAILEQDGKSMFVKCNHSIQVMKAEPLETSPKIKGQAENAGVTKLFVRLENVLTDDIIIKFSGGLS